MNQLFAPGRCPLHIKRRIKIPYNGSGTFTLDPANFPYVTGQVVDATKQNNNAYDLAAGLTTALTKDGQTTPTANIPMGGFKITGAGAATAAGDVVSLSSNLGITLGGVGARIMGDLTNAMHSSRLLFQTNVTNAISVVGAIPAGTATTSSFQAYNNSDPTTASILQLRAEASAAKITSSISGVGASYLPIQVVVGASAFVPVTYNIDGSATETGNRTLTGNLTITGTGNRYIGRWTQLVTVGMPSASVDVSDAGVFPSGVYGVTFNSVTYPFVFKRGTVSRSLGPVSSGTAGHIIQVAVTYDGVNTVNCSVNDLNVTDGTSSSTTGVIQAFERWD